MAYKQSVFFAAGLLVGASVTFAANKFRHPDEPLLSVAQTKNTIVESQSPVDSPVSDTVQAITAAPADVDTPSQETLQYLLQRVEQAELRITALEESIASVPAENAVPDWRRGRDREAVSADELINAGFDPFVVDTIEVIRNEVQLERLDLRDRATREGWVNSDEFRDAMRELSRDGRLRESLGDDEYDRLLIAEGRPNRVEVDGVIENSAADIAGIQQGDIVYRYADERIFTFRDLRRATTAGDRDQPVNLQLLRNNEPLDVVVPRGPLGVTISGVSHDHSG